MDLYPEWMDRPPRVISTGGGGYSLEEAMDIIGTKKKINIRLKNIGEDYKYTKEQPKISMKRIEK